MDDNKLSFRRWSSLQKAKEPLNDNSEIPIESLETHKSLYEYKYEAIIIFSPEIEPTFLINTIKEKLKYEEKLLDMDVWGIRKLAYTIKNFKEGYYVIYKFKGEVSFIITLENILNDIPQIIKHVITNINEEGSVI